MKLSDYINILEQSTTITTSQSKEIEQVLENFPYFQSARALYLKSLYDQDSYKYNFVLRKTAAYTTDRSVLFDYITSKDFNTKATNQTSNQTDDVAESSIDIELDNTIEREHHETNHNKEIATATDAEHNEHLTEQSEDTIENIISTDISSTQEESIDNLESSEIDLPEFIIEKTEIEFIPVQELPIEQFEIVSSRHNSLSEETIKDNESTTTTVEYHEKQEQKTILTSEEILDLGKPLQFNTQETHSFQEWLQLTKIQPINREVVEEQNETTVVPENTAYSNTVTSVIDSKTAEKDSKEIETSQETQVLPEEKRKKLELIDRFIELNPKIPSPKDQIVTSAKPIETQDSTTLMTETLARVYLEQKKYSKAIQAYEILILKYPEKSVFFANRIKEIKKIQQNNIQ